MPLRNKAYFRPFFLLVSACLVALDVIRIMTVPATHDEVATFDLLQNSYADLLGLKVYVTANFHLLNLLITKFCISTFADNLFFLRVGNLGALVLYLAYAYALSMSLFKERWWQVCVFLVLNLNPFLFDFWGLSRGYGLAIALMTASIYHLLQYNKGHKALQLMAACVLGGLAVYSSFSLLNYFVAMAGIALLSGAFFSGREGALKRVVIALCVVSVGSGLLYLLIASPIRKLIDAKQLFHGGSTGFFPDTLRSVVKESLFANDIHAPVATAVSIIAVVIVVFSALYWLWQVLRRKATAEAQPGILLWLLLMIPIAATIVQHYLYDTRFLVDRTALFLYVPFMLATLAWLQSLLASNKAGGSFLIGALTSLFLYNFICNINARSTRQWAYDRNTLVVLDRLRSKQPFYGRKVRMVSYWIFGPSVAYHINHGYDKYVESVPTALQLLPPIDTSFDYYYIPVEYTDILRPVYTADTFFTVSNKDVHDGQFVLMKKTVGPAGRGQ